MTNNEEKVTPKPKTYTGKDLMAAAKEILKEDTIGKKLPDDVIETLARLLAKNAMKGDL
jgi:hypothetical protein